MVKKQHGFSILHREFWTGFNIYVFICNECCNQIISYTEKIKSIASRGREGERLPKKVFTDVLAQALGFSGINFCLGIRLWEVTFVKH